MKPDVAIESVRAQAFTVPTDRPGRSPGRFQLPQTAIHNGAEAGSRP
jgi:hypothetical protein